VAHVTNSKKVHPGHSQFVLSRLRIHVRSVESRIGLCGTLIKPEVPAVTFTVINSFLPVLVPWIGGGGLALVSVGTMDLGLGITQFPNFLLVT